MREHRHAHPHLDPRQPRDGSRPGTNPPVFAWKPTEKGGPFHLRVARDATLRDPCLARDDLVFAACRNLMLGRGGPERRGKPPLRMRR